MDNLKKYLKYALFGIGTGLSPVNADQISQTQYIEPDGESIYIKENYFLSPQIKSILRNNNDGINLTNEDKINVFNVVFGLWEQIHHDEKNLSYNQRINRLKNEIVHLDGRKYLELIQIVCNKFDLDKIECNLKDFYQDLLFNKYNKYSSDEKNRMKNLFQNELALIFTLFQDQYFLVDIEKMFLRGEIQEKFKKNLAQINREFESNFSNFDFDPKKEGTKLGQFILNSKYKNNPYVKILRRIGDKNLEYSSINNLELSKINPVLFETINEVAFDLDLERFRKIIHLIAVIESSYGQNKKSSSSGAIGPTGVKKNTYQTYKTKNMPSFSNATPKDIIKLSFLKLKKDLNFFQLSQNFSSTDLIYEIPVIVISYYVGLNRLYKLSRDPNNLFRNLEKNKKNDVLGYIYMLEILHRANIS